MKIGLLVLLCLLCLVTRTWTAQGNHWALLVAGANTYTNYASQACICHAYQILKAHGIPDERIVVMMYDDIAYNKLNPDKGKIINRPGGPNVYEGVPKDYIKEDVTPETFLKVLQGEKTGTGSGKTINSGPNDNIFVNMVDHGVPDGFLFPTGVLRVNRLMLALKSMHQKKKYNQMVFYMESCYSGSMFHNFLPKNINIFATTAATPTESAYACYWDDHVGAYVGAVYSCNWMENSDKKNLTVETLQDQYEIVKMKTNTSHVQEYGDMKMGSDVLDDFQGINNRSGYVFDPFQKMGSDVLDDFQGINNRSGYVFDPFQGVLITDAVPSVDVPLRSLDRKIEDTGRYSNGEIFAFIEERKALLLRRERTLTIMESIAGMSGSTRVNAKEYFLNSRQEITEYSCYQTATDEINQICFDGRLWQEPFASQMYVLINMCEDRVPIENIISAMRQACQIEN